MQARCGCQAQLSVQVLRKSTPRRARVVAVAHKHGISNQSDKAAPRVSVMYMWSVSAPVRMTGPIAL
jgi:hypothetical protein